MTQSKEYKVVLNPLQEAPFARTAPRISSDFLSMVAVMLTGC